MKMKIRYHSILRGNTLLNNITKNEELSRVFNIMFTALLDDAYKKEPITPYIPEVLSVLARVLVHNHVISYIFGVMGQQTFALWPKNYQSSSLIFRHLQYSFPQDFQLWDTPRPFYKVSYIKHQKIFNENNDESLKSSSSSNTSGFYQYTRQMFNRLCSR